jgi:hypothetical protein
MAAARQKEINVSITEDATISRTRSEVGATLVREDAIVIVPVKRPAVMGCKSKKTANALRRVYFQTTMESMEINGKNR